MTLSLDYQPKRYQSCWLYLMYGMIVRNAQSELLSLIGKLSFAAKVVQPGRIFLHRLTDLSTTVRELHHHILIIGESRRDIEWWLEFLPTWNVQSVIPELGWAASPDLELYTDASTVGYGAVYQTHWFSAKWPEPVVLNSIPWKELFTIYAACFVGVLQGKAKKFSCTLTMRQPPFSGTGNHQSAPT